MSCLLPLKETPMQSKYVDNVQIIHGHQVQTKHYWPFVRGIQQWPLVSLHKALVMWTLLALCEENPVVISGFPRAGPVLWSFDTSPLLSLNKLFPKQLSCWWFEMPWSSCDVITIKSLDLCWTLFWGWKTWVMISFGTLSLWHMIILSIRVHQWNLFSLIIGWFAADSDIDITLIMYSLHSFVINRNFFLHILSPKFNGYRWSLGMDK